MKTCKKRNHVYADHLKTCPECRKITRKNWAKNNSEKIKNSYKKYYEKNKAIKSVKSKYRYIKHKDKTLKKCKEYRDKNKHQYVAYSRFYQQLKRKAVPPWANKNKISWFYKEARRLSEETGIKHHVDHIYPLQSVFLCGLHVETNLQILTLSENLSKGNKTWPGQLDCQKTDKGSLSSSSSSSSSSLSHIIASSISSS